MLNALLRKVTIMRVDREGGDVTVGILQPLVRAFRVDGIGDLSMRGVKTHVQNFTDRTYQAAPKNRPWCRKEGTLLFYWHHQLAASLDEHRLHSLNYPIIR